MGLKALLKHPLAKRAMRVYLVAFGAIFVPGVIGWLNLVTQWSRSQGQAPFPNAHSLAFIGVTAIVAGCVALCNVGVDLVQKYMAEDTTTEE